MKSKDLGIIAFAIALVGVLGYLWLSPDGFKQAPDITLNQLDGQPLALADYRGHPVLVTFWATTCPGCVKEMPHLIDLYKEYAPKGVKVVGIAMEYDPPTQVRELVSLRRVPYTIALDSDGQAARAFGDVKLTPTHFLIDPQGRIIQQRLGDLDMADLRTRLNGMLAAHG